MTFSWRLTPDAAPEGPTPPPSFASQSDAESWIGETWRELAAAGVTIAALVHDGDELYSLALSE